MPNKTEDFKIVRKPKMVLKPDAYYEGDNGRILHGKCSGASATYTGRDISGQKVRRLTAADVVAFLAEVADLGITEACEQCRHAQTRAAYHAAMAAEAVRS